MSLGASPIPAGARGITTLLEPTLELLRKSHDGVEAALAVRQCRANASNVDAAVARTISTIEILERSADVVTQRLRSELKVYEGPSGILELKKESRALVQLFVALSDFLDVLGGVLEVTAAMPWGGHVLSEADFRHTDFRRLRTYGVHPEGWFALLTPATAAVDDAWRELIGLSPSLSTAADDAQAVLIQITTKCGSHWITRPRRVSSLESLDKANAAKRVGGKKKLENLIKNRQIFVLDYWQLEQRFPSFQFDRRGFNPLAQWIMDSAEIPLHSSVVAHWVATNFDRGQGWFQNELKSRALLRSAWGIPDGHDFKEDARLKAIAPIDAGSVWWRISQSRNSPFYFRQVPPDVSKNPGGRFDLSISSNRGSVYLASSPDGAAREVFHHQPVSSLHDLLGRSLWEFRVSRDIERIKDLTGMGSKLPDCDDRLATQELATYLADELDNGEPRYNGLIANLRTIGNQQALVLFGHSGPTLPSSSGLPVMLAQSVSPMSNEDVWKYLDEQQRNTTYPFVLQRLPSDVKLNIR